jgi:2-oxoglutarate ferredoxin oxidoreductase subunit beta
LALGIFRNVEQPTYDGLLQEQIQASVARRGRGDLGQLLNSGTSWEVR